MFCSFVGVLVWALIFPCLGLTQLPAHSNPLDPRSSQGQTPCGSLLQRTSGHKRIRRKHTQNHPGTQFLSTEQPMIQEPWSTSKRTGKQGISFPWKDPLCFALHHCHEDASNLSICPLLSRFEGFWLRLKQGFTNLTPGLAFREILGFVSGF